MKVEGCSASTESTESSTVAVVTVVPVQYVSFSKSQRAFDAAQSRFEARRGHPTRACLEYHAADQGLWNGLLHSAARVRVVEALKLLLLVAVAVDQRPVSGVSSPSMNHEL